jgi:sulfur-carrier protein
MSVKIDVHYFIPVLTNDRDIIEVDGNNIGQCFDQLIHLYPKVKEWLIAEDGGISNVVEVYLNHDSVQPEGLAKPVKDGDVIHIVMMISGG